MEDGFSVTCLECDKPMGIITMDKLFFEATCPHCENRAGFSFSGPCVTSLVEMGRSEVTRRMNEDLSVKRQGCQAGQEVTSRRKQVDMLTLSALVKAMCIIGRH